MHLFCRKLLTPSNALSETFWGINFKLAEFYLVTQSYNYWVKMGKGLIVRSEAGTIVIVLANRDEQERGISGKNRIWNS